MTSLLRSLFLLVLFTGGAFAAAPKITNPTALILSSTTATLSAQITASSGSPVKVFFDYGLTTGYGQTLNLVATSNADAELKITPVITGLLAGATYHFRVRAETVEGDKAATADQTFAQSATVALGTVGHNATTGAITLNGTVVPNGVSGTAIFEYGEGNAFDKTAPAAPVAVSGALTIVPVTAPLTDGTFGSPVFNYRLVFNPTSGTPLRIVSTVGKTNTAPIAVADAVTLTDSEPLTIDVLDNDSDVDGDTLTIQPLTQPRQGTVAIVGDTIVFTPTANFTSAVTFSYTIKDGFGGTATAKVTVQTLGGSVAGTHGGVLKDEKGHDVGYFSITATSLGSFTGVLVLRGHKYALMGSFDAAGNYTGMVLADGKTIPVELSLSQADSVTTLVVDVGQGAWKSEVSFSDTEATTRTDLAGRYTIELPGAATTSTTDGTSAVGTDTTTTTTTSTVPEGTGWAVITVLPDGTAVLKGKLPDGQGFQTRGVLGVDADGAKVTFYSDRRETLIVGSFTVGDTVAGSLRVIREEDNDLPFPAGYDTTLSANGARFLQPEKGSSFLNPKTGFGSDRLTMTFSGGDLDTSFSRTIRVSHDGKTKVLDSGTEDLSVKVDRKSGRFKAKATVTNEGQKISGTGVLVQGTSTSAGGSGGGVFRGVNKTPGRIAISLAADSSPTTPTTPTIPTTPDTPPITLPQ